MTKTELITVLARTMCMPKTHAEHAIDAICVTMASALKSGHDVPLTGFGVLRIVDKPARTARNPNTGEAIQVPAHKTVKFKPSKTLLDTL